MQPGDWVGILGEFGSLPILRDVYEAVIDAGGHPSLLIDDERMQRYFLRHASAEQMNWIDPGLKRYTEEGDVYIRVGAPENTRAMSSVSAAKMQAWRAAQARSCGRAWSEPRAANSAGWGRSIQRRPARRKPI